MGSIEKTAKSKIDLIRDEIAERQKNFLKFSSGDPEGTKERAKDPYDFYYEYYFSDIKDNLLNGKMDKEHWWEYRWGSGGETRPPKMACVYSSSAMAFNLLGNKKVTFISDSTKKQYFTPDGHAIEYDIKYEKQLQILTGRGAPANFDAFLYNDKERKAIFCEMKMTEWLNKPDKNLSSAYLEENRYFYKNNYKFFEDLIKKMKKDPMHKRYDRWQMFKHTLAIFNATCHENHDSDVKRAIPKVTFKDKYDKITLINVVYMPGANNFSDSLQEKYNEMEKEETEGFKYFREMMLESGLQERFEKKCGVDFNIVFITAHEFIDCMEKTNSEKKYLERYW
ncbi:MAG: hypothetical protein IKT09_08735 [Synergistes sp.]|nr:hypothetical protein [Synergistes sp.]